MIVLGAAVWLGLRAGDYGPPEKTSARVTTGPGSLEKTGEIPSINPEPGVVEPGSPPQDGPVALRSSPVPTDNPEPPTGGERLEQWLSSSTDLEVVVHHIINGFGTLKLEDQAPAASKIVAFIKDERFADLKPLLMDPATSEEAQNIIYQDLLQRSASTRLPLLFTLMQTPNHPFSDKARQSLVRDLGADYGANYGLWQAKINELIGAQK